MWVKGALCGFSAFYAVYAFYAFYVHKICE